MNTKMMIRCALVGAVALLAASCFSKEDYMSKYDSNILIAFEPNVDSQWEDFVAKIFGGEADTVAFHETVSMVPIYHFASLSGNEFQGGMLLCRGKDANASADRKPSYFAVYDANYGRSKSHCYAVFHDTTAVLMPERCIQIAIPNEESSCTLTGLYVHNVQAAVQAAQTGKGLAGGPFQAGDFLTLSITGYRNKTVTGTMEIKLIDGTQAVTEWKAWETPDLGNIDAIDFHLTSSRPDFPLYCCVDDMLYHYTEIYQ